MVWQPGRRTLDGFVEVGYRKVIVDAKVGWCVSEQGKEGSGASALLGDEKAPLRGL